MRNTRLQGELQHHLGTDLMALRDLEMVVVCGGFGGVFGGLSEVVIEVVMMVVVDFDGWFL